MPTNFTFLQAEWPSIHEAAVKAETFAYPDPGTACIHARRALEIAMQWVFKTDIRLQVPYQQTLSALVHEPTFIDVAGQGLQTKARLIIEHGNRAAHSTHRTITDQHSVAAVRELFHFTYWLARTYARAAKPAPTLIFQPQLLPRTSPVPPQARARLKELEESLTTRDAQLAELVSGKAALDTELAQLRAEIAEARKRNEAVPDTHDYSEAQTRDEFIDLLLAEAGWDLADPQDREYKVEGIPSPSGVGYIDYVLWGRDGKPLALVEAKRSRKNPEAGQQQAKLYADSLEKKFGQRPVPFYTNGYQHWLWDDVQYPPRQVSGFYTHDELVLLHQRRRGSRQTLTDLEVKPEIANRYYQSRAIRKVTERFELHHQRRALLVMATGAGKTRTVIALCELLMRAGWVKRVLFLADRLALVKQAANAFKTHLSSSSPVNLVSERSESSRVYLSTYPTMMGLIDEKNEDGTRRFGAGHFDLVIVDEAHRSIYRKYAAIFDYFDSFLVGLTATPKDEVDRNTYRQFVLEDGVPTDEYPLEAAIKDQFLVPPKSVSVPLKFQREGIRYSELSDEEKDQWDALEWEEEDGQTPQEVDPAALNNWLFNEDTVDKVLQHLMEKGQKVASGDRLGKTIIFAKNHDHAQFIAKRFDANYPKDAGHFARVIDFQTGAYAQTLIDAFSQPEKQPHIAISVDMLDTGIDVPEVLNLVFFKVVRSKTKFWQMVGRGTRLSPDLFGPGRNKQFFYIFDFCGNLEFFSQNPETSDGAGGESLTKKIFANRVELITTLDTIAARSNQASASEEAETKLRSEVVGRLQSEVAAMTLDNFLVRPHRKAVEQFAKPESWTTISPEDRLELQANIAGLPSTLPSETLEAKQFDLLLLRAQLTLLRGEPGFAKLRQDIETIARLLEAQSNIPAVAAKLPLLQEIQSPLFWEDVTVVCLETVRKGLRDLVQFIERLKRTKIISDFVDTLGAETSIDLPGVSVGVDPERFRDKALAFLGKHQDDAVLHKLRFNEPLTAEDLSALEAIFIAEGSTAEEINAAKESTQGLGLFVRSLIGLDRGAAKQALASFLTGKALTANQINFLDHILNHLAITGWINPRNLYASPFTDLHPHGVDGVFDPASALALISTLQDVRQNATGMRF